MVEYNPVSEAVRELVRERVHTLEHLHVLLWLRAQCGADGPEAVRDVERRLTAALSLPLALLRSTLTQLCERELVSMQRTRGEPTRWRYAPATAELDSAVRELEAAYAESSVELLQLFSSNAIERFRSGSLKLFADALRLDKKR